MPSDYADGNASASVQVVERSADYLRSRLDTPVAVSELSHALGISERRLRRAFQRVHGISPKRFMLVQRLSAVRRALHQSSGTVTEIAGSHGFSELGRFAGSYRQAFGETPSDTLRRNRG